MLISWQFIPVSASPTAKMYVHPQSQSVSAPFSVDINVTDVTDFYGWEFRLNYTTSILTATSVTEGPFLKWGPDRFLFVSDNDDFIYQAYLADPATSLASWDCGTSRPYGVEYVDGYVYYVDYGNDALYNMTTAGTYIEEWDIGGYSGDPYGLGWNGTHFIIADPSDDKIYFAPFSNPLISISIDYTGVSAPEGVTFDGTYVWVSDVGTDTVYQLNATTGSVEDSWSTATETGDPNGITWDGANLWVCDGSDIYKYATDGTLLGSFTAPASAAEGLSYAAIAPTSARSTFFNVVELSDAKGRVWVTGSITGDTPGVAGAGVLATINFTCDGSGTSPLDLHHTKLVGYDYLNKKTTHITHARYDGSVTSTAVPEFPFGAAAEIAIAAVVIYIWWRRRSTKLSKSPIRLH